MKKWWIALFAGAILTACGDDAANKEAAIELKTQKEKNSFAVGAAYAQQLLEDPNFDQYDKKSLLKGFTSGLSDNTAFDMSCQQCIQTALGHGGGVDPSNSGQVSDCIGRLLGTQFASEWKQEGYIKQFDMSVVKKGFELALNGGDTIMSMEDRDGIVQHLTGERNQKVFNRANRDEAIFFAKIAKIKGIRDLGNGLYAEVLSEGNGGSPAMGDDVLANYILTLPKGDTIESSFEAVKAGYPLQAFNLGGVVAGWSMAFPKFKKGGKYRLYVPQGLGYGGNVRPGSPIPAFSPLIFYIELIDYGKPGSLVK